MNAVFCGMMLLGVAAAAARGDADAAQRALLGGGSAAVEFLVSMTGAYALFGGLLGVLRESGVTAALARALRRPLLALMNPTRAEEAALEDMSVNLAANMLGMGGAATPAGLSAMRKLAAAGEETGGTKEKKDTGTQGRMSGAMQLFLLLNMCSVQLLPTTMIAVRAQGGAQNPADIVLPTLLATGVQAATGVTLCKILSARNKSHG